MCSCCLARVKEASAQELRTDEVDLIADGPADVFAPPDGLPARDLIFALEADRRDWATVEKTYGPQKAWETVIIGCGADYVMTVKGNMPTLYKQLKKLPWARIPSVSSVSKDHGCRARRTIKVALAPAWIGFEGAAQVAELRRTVAKKGKKPVEVVLPHHQRPYREPGDPGRLGPPARAHREQAPLVRDVTYLEDKSSATIRTGNAPA